MAPAAWGGATEQWDRSLESFTLIATRRAVTPTTSGALEPYVAIGRRRFNFVPEAEGPEAAIETIGRVKEAGRRHAPAAG